MQECSYVLDQRSNRSMSLFNLCSILLALIFPQVDVAKSPYRLLTPIGAKKKRTLAIVISSSQRFWSDGIRLEQELQSNRISGGMVPKPTMKAWLLFPVLLIAPAAG